MGMSLINPSNRRGIMGMSLIILSNRRGIMGISQINPQGIVGKHAPHHQS